MPNDILDHRFRAAELTGRVFGCAQMAQWEIEALLRSGRNVGPHRSALDRIAKAIGDAIAAAKAHDAKLFEQPQDAVAVAAE